MIITFEKTVYIYPVKVFLQFIYFDFVFFKGQDLMENYPEKM